jgi:hypothetical protein
VSGYPYERRPAPERRRRSRGRLALTILGGLLVLAVVFALGVALGEALKRDAPPSGRLQTSVRTLEPLPQRPAGG